MFEGMFRNVFQFLNENLFVYFKLRNRNANDNSSSNSNSSNNRVNRLVKKNDEEITSNVCLRSSFDASNNAVSIGSRSIGSNSSSRLKINETSERTQTVILLTTEENV
jgi:hypothetical protein